jgi:hypothetical protein
MPRELLIALVFLGAVLGAAPAAAAPEQAPAESTSTAPAPPAPFMPAQLQRAGEELGDRDLLIGLGIGSLATLALLPVDDEIVDWFVDQQPLGPNAVDIGYWIGHRQTVAASSILLMGGGLAFGSPYVRDTGFLFVESHLVVAGVTQILKAVVGRERPDGSNDNSFPSGHASSAMTSATVLQLRFGWWVGAPAYLAAIYTGLSRVQGDKHYLSDVVFGWVLAWYLSSAIVRASDPRPGERGYVEKTLSWLPPPEPGDTGLALVRLRF